VPYCKPMCMHFKLVADALGKVVGECIKCGLHHNLTVDRGQVQVKDRE
jgi:hypothetical protein